MRQGGRAGIRIFIWGKGVCFMYDVIIIGSGPAGVSAALYAARGGLSVLILSNGIGELAKAGKIDNYYGAPGISGAEIYETGLAQAKALGVHIVGAEATVLSGFSPFGVEAGGAKYEGKAVVIATGRPRKKPKLPRADELEGKGVSYCAVCDGFFFRGRSVGVLGAGPFALSEAAALAGVASRVVLLTNGEEPASAPPEGVLADKRRLAGLSGERALDGVLTEDGGKIPLDGLFIALGTASGADFAASAGILLEDGYIKIDRSGATNVPGIFAAGDAAGGFLQMSAAVGEGAAAGHSAAKFVKGSK